MGQLGRHPSGEKHGRDEMKQGKHLFYAVIIILQVSILGCSSSRQFVGVLRNLTPESKLSLCKYELIAGSNTAALFGLIGAVADEIKNSHDRPYYQDLCMELNRISEDTLKLGTSFKYCPSEELTVLCDGELMPIDMIAKANNLFACVSAKSTLGIAFGWNKEIVLRTWWEITGPSGWKLEIETEAVSKDTYGTFPDVGDPGLRPVWLDLAKESVKQFQEKFYEMMKEARSMN